MDEQTGQTSDETLSEILDAVTGGFTSVSDIERQGYDTLASHLESIGSAVSALSDSTSSTSDTGGVVELDDSQFGVIQLGLQVISAEGFILVCVMAIQCGLTCWRVFSGGMRG